MSLWAEMAAEEQAIRDMEKRRGERRRRVAELVAGMDEDQLNYVLHLIEHLPALLKVREILAQPDWRL